MTTTINTPKLILTPELEQFDSLNSNFLNLAMTALRLTNLTSSFGKSKTTSIILKTKILELPEISLNEVSNHDSLDDCWIVIYDRIYDVTKFLKMHPGGYDIILEHAGRDATLAFRGTGHTESAIQSLKLYEIGQLPLKERIYRCENGIRCWDLPE